MLIAHLLQQSHQIMQQRHVDDHQGSAIFALHGSRIAWIALEFFDQRPHRFPQGPLVRSQDRQRQIDLRQCHQIVGIILHSTPELILSRFPAFELEQGQCHILYG